MEDQVMSDLLYAVEGESHLCYKTPQEAAKKFFESNPSAELCTIVEWQPGERSEWDNEGRMKLVAPDAA